MISNPLSKLLAAKSYSASAIFTCAINNNVIPNKYNPILKKGVIDLRDWNFEINGAVNLKGKWEFYWNQHRSPDKFTGNNSDSISGYIDVPGAWNDFIHKGEKLPGFGFATYRARVLLKDKQ